MDVNPQQLRRAANEWRAADLDPVVAETIEKALNRHDDIETDCRATIDRLTQIAKEKRPTPDPAVGLALGNLNVEAAITAQHDAWQHTFSPADRDATLRLARKARQMVIGDLLVDLRGRSTQPILSAAHDAVIADATKLVAVVAGITTDTDAIAAPPKQREAWSKLTALAARREQILNVLRLLNSFGLAPTRSDTAPPFAESFRNPDLLDRSLVQEHTAHALVGLIDSGCEPAILSPAELAQRWPAPAKEQPQSARPLVRTTGP